MKEKMNMINKFCCVMAVVAIIVTSAGNVFAGTGLTAGQASVKNIGAEITWYDVGKYTDYYISDVYDDKLYRITVNNGDEYKIGVVNGKGEMVLAPDVYNVIGIGGGEESITMAEKGGVGYLIGKDGVKTVDMSAYSDMKNFDDKYITVTVKSSGRNAVIDHSGKVLFEDKTGNYKNLRFICDGVFSGELGDNRYQLLDDQGNLLTETVYSDVWGASEDLVRVQSADGKSGFVTVTGETAVPMSYEQALLFSDGLAGVKNAGKWGFIDKENQTVIPFIYDSVDLFYEGVTAVSAGERYGLIDKTGAIVLPIEYETYPLYEGGIFHMSKENKTVLFHTADRSIETKDYSSYEKNKNGSIYVGKIENGKTVNAYLDRDENMLTGFKEYALYNFDDETYLAKKPGDYPPGVVPPHDYSQKFALLDKGGNNLTGFKYSNAGYSAKGYQVFFQYYYDGATLVNQNGAEVLPPVFDDIRISEDGYALICISDPQTGANSRVGYFKIPDSFAEVKGSRPITVYLNGIELYFESQPVIKEQKTVVPMRKIFESLGASVQWDNATKTVTAVSGEKTVKLTIGSEYADVNGEKVKLDSKPFIENDSTFVPLRFVSESLGAQVKWDGDLRRVIITRK